MNFLEFSLVAAFIVMLCGTTVAIALGYHAIKESITVHH